MTNQFSKKVSDILMQSKEEAQRTDSKDVKPEHLLLGIMKSGTKPIYTLLYDKNVKPEAVRSELERRVCHLPAVTHLRRLPTAQMAWTI